MVKSTSNEAKTAPGAKSSVVLLLAWLSVGLPLLWGVAQTIRKTLALFR
jgi:hypothetical protein